MARVCNFGRTGRGEGRLAGAVAVVMMVVGLLGEEQVLGANIQVNSGFEPGNFSNWTTFGAGNYALPGTNGRFFGVTNLNQVLNGIFDIALSAAVAG